MPDADQGWQREKQRRQHSDANSLHGGEEVPMRGGLQFKITRQECREGALDNQTEDDTEQTARQPERDGLQ